MTTYFNNVFKNVEQENCDAEMSISTNPESYRKCNICQNNHSLLFGDIVQV